MSSRDTYVGVQQGDESALEQLVAVKGKVVGHPGQAGGSQAGPEVSEGIHGQEALGVVVAIMLSNVLKVVGLTGPHLWSCVSDSQ
jgi:hypothetical protein